MPFHKVKSMYRKVKNMTSIEIISYGANIIFVTHGVVSFFNERKRSKEIANYLNGSYEMSIRLSDKLGKSKYSGQANDIASIIKSIAMNFMNKKRNEIDGYKHRQSKIKNLKKLLLPKNIKQKSKSKNNLIDKEK